MRRGVIDMQYGPASYNLGKMPEADAWVGATVTAMEARENGGFELMQQATEEKLKGVLTEEQQTKWQELTGKKFEGQLQGPGGRGPGRGRRGPRPGPGRALDR